MSLDGVKEKFENFISDVMMQEHIPGLSLAIVKDGKVVYARGFGARNLKANLPATPDTLYAVGSCAKSFTAMAVMQLQEQGRLNVNDPVSKYLPDFTIGSKTSPIRIRHLLSHSSGIPLLGTVEAEVNRFIDGDEKWVPLSSFDDMMSHINGAKDEVAANPGEKYFYLNEGYALLGLIVEKVSKICYTDYIRENILKPLKMDRSGFPNQNLDKDADVATPYLVQRKESTLVATPSNFPIDSLVYAGGGLQSSVKELAYYLIANMNGGIFEGVKVLGSKLLNEMHKPRVEVDVPGYFGKSCYGYGWVNNGDFFGHECIGHIGSILVSNADLRFVPDLNIGVAVASNNGAAESVFLIAPIVLGLLMGRDPMKEIPIFEIEKKMCMLVGEYESYKGISKISVVRKGGILFLESKEKLSEINMALIPEDDHLESFKFYMLAGGLKVPAEFVVDSLGKVDLYALGTRFHKVK